jgi:hypothetical protein
MSRRDAAARLRERAAGPGGRVAVLAACGSAIVRLADDRLEAVAGGFDGNVHLLEGPGGEPWALSGHGASFGSGDGSLALTRIGAKAGDQHRHDIYFQAKVNVAGWRGDLRFFLASTGQATGGDMNSALTDRKRGCPDRG